MYYNNKKLALSIFWVVLGLTLFILSVAEVLDDSVYAGMGAALTVIGALQIWRNLKYRRDPEYREKIDIEAGDERNNHTHAVLGLDRLPLHSGGRRRQRRRVLPGAGRHPADALLLHLLHARRLLARERHPEQTDVI